MLDLKLITGNSHIIEVYGAGESVQSALHYTDLKTGKQESNLLYCCEKSVMPSDH